MTESARSRYVIELLSFMVTKHSMGDDICQRCGPSAEIKVEPAIVIQVAEIRTHRQQQFVEVHFFGNVSKRPVAVISVEPRSMSPGLVLLRDTRGQYWASSPNIPKKNDLANSTRYICMTT